MVPLAIDAAREDLLTYLSFDSLRAVSLHTCMHEHRQFMRAGFAGLHKQVEIEVYPPLVREHTTVIPIRWTPTGWSRSLFPTLKAEIELAPIDENTSRLALAGHYQPPLGHFGEELDHFALHHVARATARRFLSNLALAMVATKQAPRDELDPAGSELATAQAEFAPAVAPHTTTASPDLAAPSKVTSIGARRRRRSA